MGTVAFTFCHLTEESVRPPLPSYPGGIKTIGDHIRHRRLDFGMYQKDVAEYIGVITDTITNWELGRTNPEIRYIPGIIQFLGYVPFTVGKSFSERLRAYRMIRGLSQKECAKVFGVDPTTLMKWETGSSSPYRSTKIRVDSLIDVELSSILK